MEDSNSPLTKQEELHNIKKYCHLLSTNSEYQVGPFYTFFNIPGEAMEDNDSNTTQDYQDKLNQSGNDSQERERNMMLTTCVNEWKLFSLEDSRKYLLFYRVKMENYHKNDDGVYFFKFSIFSFINDNLKLTLEKRYSEFIRLENKLEKVIKARPPPLPGKVIVHNDSSMIERGTQLEEWLTVVCNDRIFHCEALFAFINAPKTELSQLIRIPAVSKTNIIVCQVADHASVNAKAENFIVYNIKVEIRDRVTKESIHQHWVGRRFREVVVLHETLKRMFQHYKMKLPELPSKLSAFSSAEKRQTQLDNYFKKLLGIEEILDVLIVRKFLNLESSSLKLTKLL